MITTRKACFRTCNRYKPGLCFDNPSLKITNYSKSANNDLESSRTSSYVESIFFKATALSWGNAELMTLSFLRIARFSNPRKAASPTAYTALALRVPIPPSMVSVEVVVGNEIIEGGRDDVKDKLECLSRPFMIATCEIA